MTGRVTFGDFLQAAHRHLEGTAAFYRDGGTRGNMDEVPRSLLREIIAMRRYLDDITATLHDKPARGRPVLTPWVLASLQAREALANATGFLARPRALDRPTVLAASPLARRLDAVTTSLVTGRDLLRTHFAARSRSAPQPRSEWGAVITSAPVTRALLEEIAWLARHSAQYSANVALLPSPGTSVSTAERQQLSAACQWLRALDASVRTASQRDPVTDSDRELLRAIPVNAIPARPAITGGEPVTVVWEALASIAERVRYLAWASAHETSRLPAVTAVSLRQVAEASTVTSHHCHLLLNTLATRSAQAGLTEVSGQLTAAADAAVDARQTWLHTARAVRQVTTGAPDDQPALASEAQELALWTGRLAYEHPAWTLASGPDSAVRVPESLVPDRGGLPVAVAAVHQACHTLSLLSQTEQERIRAASRAGCILVPTQSLPNTYDIPRPFARAPVERVDLLLDRYADSWRASREATAGVELAAETVRAPSRVLAAARRAVRAMPSGLGADRTDALNRRAEPGSGSPSSAVPVSPPGPVGQALHRLGITRPDLLSRAADIDRAGERLILDAAAEVESFRRRSALELNRSTGTTTLINHALMSGDPRAAALLSRPPAREPPEREAEP